MTDKQIERVKAKIVQLKKALSDDKKFWHGYYHDGRGIRYMLPAQYIKINDYRGGLRYINWFGKNFAQDAGYPIFLFECTFILYKCNKIAEATRKAYSTFFSNTHLFNVFLERESTLPATSKTEDHERQMLVYGLSYKKDHPEFIEFAGWIETVLNSKEFLDLENEFFTIQQQLEDEPVGAKRTELLSRLSAIQYA